MEIISYGTETEAQRRKHLEKYGKDPAKAFKNTETACTIDGTVYKLEMADCSKRILDYVQKNYLTRKDEEPYQIGAGSYQNVPNRAYFWTARRDKTWTAWVVGAVSSFIIESDVMVGLNENFHDIIGTPGTANPGASPLDALLTHATEAAHTQVERTYMKSQGHGKIMKEDIFTPGFWRVCPTTLTPLNRFKSVGLSCSGHGKCMDNPMYEIERREHLRKYKPNDAKFYHSAYHGEWQCITTMAPDGKMLDPNGAHPAPQCSGHGKCNRQYITEKRANECECNKGWVAPDCSVAEKNNGEAGINNNPGAYYNMRFDEKNKQKKYEALTKYVQGFVDNLGMKKWQAYQCQCDKNFVGADCSIEGSKDLINTKVSDYDESCVACALAAPPGKFFEFPLSFFFLLLPLFFRVKSNHL